jgi:alpha-galactosidase
MTRLATLLLLILVAKTPCAAAADGAKTWQERLLAVPYAAVTHPDHMMLELVRQDFEALERNQSILKTPLAIGSRTFKRGLGTHAVSRIRVYSPDPIARFSSWIGVDKNERTAGGLGSVVFAVTADGKEVFRSRIFRGGQEGQQVDLATGGARTLDLKVDDAGDGLACDHADWAEAAVTTASGKVVPLDAMPLGCLPANYARYPFSFTYGDKSSDGLLPAWKRDEHSIRLDSERTRLTTVWTDAKSGLKVYWDAVRYADFPAVEWVLYFENVGNCDTAVIENVRAMDLTLSSPLGSVAPYLLHSAKGGVPNPSQSMPKTCVIDEKNPATLGSETGRSSTKNLPFFRLDAGGETFVAAIGWSGCWRADFVSSDSKRLHVTSGMEKTHFLLHPGEKVRSPRILVLRWAGEAIESTAAFRQLVYKHYAARRNGKPPLPAIFCNTCFTRGGGWLNECNAENQISLIRAYAPLGLEALLTDAGRFTGGWPDGAGNWDARKDAYPNGMRPVARAALDAGMIYGLWYEPERVVAATGIHKEHPQWCLRSGPGPQSTYLLNFGLPEVQRHFFKIVESYMNLPGFRVYRQDFNMDPLPYWRYNDAPNRQGITEMKYIEGLYAYWDRIAAAWPDSLMEECASGGHRMDLETVMRMHIHQKTDYWFDDQADQTAIFGLSQYLPNNVIVAHLKNLDTYSFHSTMASSLCLGWIADGKDFDSRRGKQLIDRYKEVRHLLVGGWYPLLPCPNDYVDLNTRDVDLWLWGGGDVSKHKKPYTEWVATQYHRPDLNEGMVLAFRRPESPYSSVQVSLRGIDPTATYEVSWDSKGRKDNKMLPGSKLIGGFEIVLPEKRSSDLIVYHKVATSSPRVRPVGENNRR